jgi:preprotein translocase subunit YajC
LAAGLASLLTTSFTEETIIMNRKHLYLLSFVFLSIGVASPAQAPDPEPASQDQTQGPPPGGGNSRRGGPRDGHGTVGKITAIHGNSLQVARPDGSTVTVNLTDKTEYRKDRQPVQLSDFKVGDFVMVRGDENPDHSVNAQSLSGRSANAGSVIMSAGPGSGAAFGEMGKDFVAGVVKSVDAPKLTVLRADNVTQTLELNEDTSLHKGRESITMADIQPGDHIVVRGGLQNNAFVPKAVIVLSAEQWERMQQFAQGRAGQSGNAAAKAPAGNSPQQ